jgi:hypothetical protein
VEYCKPNYIHSFSSENYP